MQHEIDAPGDSLRSVEDEWSHGNSPVMSFQKQKRPQWGALNNDAGIHDLSDAALRSHSSKSPKTATKHLKNQHETECSGH